MDALPMLGIVTAKFKMLKGAKIKMLTMVKWWPLRQNGMVSRPVVEGTTYAESGASFHDQEPV
jgi:hypothetical protein